ncbi:hypothetical protein DL89DRAFT_264042 [Linderina pennispora]|uniref:Uncharacterized protein n=1 Tax=Linderina pennispora TaxID=61395 RepID=A0A1Y1WKI6_9FUNG|nr:uncharacterized protein DL89DRAFT_264042 [Linderina pennispora]ORX74057.1 hypothetical protein DL89DRAFT_264042 [Linderina pennispora]
MSFSSALCSLRAEPPRKIDQNDGLRILLLPLLPVWYCSLLMPSCPDPRPLSGSDFTGISGDESFGGGRGCGVLNCVTCTALWNALVLVGGPWSLLVLSRPLNMLSISRCDSSESTTELVRLSGPGGPGNL